MSKQSKKIRITNWYFNIKSNAALNYPGKNFYVYIEGEPYPSDGLTFLQTKKIDEFRVNNDGKIVKSSDGKIYSLEPPISRMFSDLHSYPVDLIDKFTTGFPKNGLLLIEQFYEKKQKEGWPSEWEKLQKAYIEIGAEYGMFPSTETENHEDVVACTKVVRSTEQLKTTLQQPLKLQNKNLAIVNNNTSTPISSDFANRKKIIKIKPICSLSPIPNEKPLQPVVNQNVDNGNLFTTTKKKPDKPGKRAHFPYHTPEVISTSLQRTKFGRFAKPRMLDPTVDLVPIATEHNVRATGPKNSEKSKKLVVVNKPKNVVTKKIELKAPKNWTQAEIDLFHQKFVELELKTGVESRKLADILKSKTANQCVYYARKYYLKCDQFTKKETETLPTKKNIEPSRNATTVIKKSAPPPKKGTLKARLEQKEKLKELVINNNNNNDESDDDFFATKALNDMQIRNVNLIADDLSMATTPGSLAGRSHMQSCLSRSSTCGSEHSEDFTINNCTTGDLLSTKIKNTDQYVHQMQKLLQKGNPRIKSMITVIPKQPFAKKGGNSKPVAKPMKKDVDKVLSLLDRKEKINKKQHQKRRRIESLSEESENEDQDDDSDIDQDKWTDFNDAMSKAY